MANSPSKIIEIAKQMIADQWVYIYGYKGKVATDAATKQLIARYPNAFDAQTRALALKKTGKTAIDCSGFVCRAAGIPSLGSGQIYDQAKEKWSLSDFSHVQNAMFIWRKGHVGLIEIDESRTIWILEAKGTRYDLTRTPWDQNKSSFTHYGAIPGVEYPEAPKTASPTSPLLSTVTGNLWLRSSPLLNDFNKLLVIPKDSIISVWNTEHEVWWQISYNGTSGYSSSRYIYRPWVGKVTAKALHVRQGPGTNAPLLKAYPYLGKDNLIDILGESGAAPWYQARIANQYFGYVSGKYIERN